MDIIKDNRICHNPMGATLHDAKRYQLAPQPRQEEIFKHRKVKRAGLPEEVKANTIFDFNFYKNNQKPKQPKEIKKPKPNKKFDVKQDNKGTKTVLKNLN